MADDRRIIIELKTTDSDDGDGKQDGKQAENPQSAEKRKNAIKSALKTTIDYAYNEITAQISYDFGKYTSLTEDYKAQMVYTNVATTIGKVKSLASATISGAMLGAKIGAAFGGAGVGAGVGAVVSLIATGVSEGMSLARQHDQQKLQLQVMDRQSEYAMSRLGLVDNGRGTQN